MDQQPSPPLGYALAQSSGSDSLERAQVMLEQSLTRRQMSHRMRAQVQTVEMSHGQLASVMPRVMRGGFVPVPIGGEIVVTSQFWNLRQPIMQRAIGGGNQRIVNVVEHCAPSLTLKAAK